MDEQQENSGCAMMVTGGFVGMFMITILFIIIMGIMIVALSAPAVA